MKAYRHVVLSPSELATLENGYKNGSKFHFRIRCHSLILSSQGLKVTEIASFYKKDEETIRKWMNKWASQGLSGLMIAKGRGKKPALRECVKETVTLVKKNSRATSEVVEHSGRPEYSIGD